MVLCSGVLRSIRFVIRPVLILSSMLLISCASNPNKISAAYVSPLKYQHYDCQQIATEMEHVSERTTKLRQQLEKERNADNWQMGVGLVLFWPTLFFLEGGDGPEAAEYAQLQGEFEALQDNSVSKKCGISSQSPEEMLKAENADEREQASKSVEQYQAKHTSDVKKISEETNCRKAVSLKEVTDSSESWSLACADGKVVNIHCESDSCRVQK